MVIPVTDERVMRILKQVENKEISPDEAVRLIEALDSLDSADSAGEDNRQETPARETGEPVTAAERPENQEAAAEKPVDSWSALGRSAGKGDQDDDDLDGVIEGLNSIFAGLGDAVQAVVGIFSGRRLGGGRQFEFTEVREGAFEVDRPELNFRCHNGRISIEGWDKDTYMLEIKKTVNAPSEDQARQTAAELLEITDSPDRLVVQERSSSSGYNFKADIKLFVPSNLEYRSRVGFHNGLASLKKLRIDDCVVDMHNGRINIGQVIAGLLTISTHNGDAHLEGIDAKKCSISMHNGRIVADVKSNQFSASAHNGQIRLELSTGCELTSSVTVHNGSIDVGLERAEDIGYRIEYSMHAGRSRSVAIRDVLDELKSVKPSSGHSGTEWAGQSPDYENKPRKITAKCEVHNGSISIGWAS